MPANKSLSIATVLEKNKVASAVPFLLCLDVTVVDPSTQSDVETLRLVKNSENVTWNGNVYTAAEFDVELKEEAGAQPEINLTVVDYTKTIAQRLESYGGGVGFKVTVSVVHGTTGTLPSLKPEVQFFFEIIGASVSEYVCSFTLGAENPLTKLFPRRLQVKNFCAWRYKDPATCKYAGGIVGCDFTLSGPNGCKAHNNEANFGAFPGINNAGSRYF
jgi:phage-related protein